MLKYGWTATSSPNVDYIDFSMSFEVLTRRTRSDVDCRGSLA